VARNRLHKKTPLEVGGGFKGSLHTQWERWYGLGGEDPRESGVLLGGRGNQRIACKGRRGKRGGSGQNKLLGREDRRLCMLALSGAGCWGEAAVIVDKEGGRWERATSMSRAKIHREMEQKRKGVGRGERSGGSRGVVGQNAVTGGMI